jgi:uncharacterized membrane protein
MVKTLVRWLFTFAVGAAGVMHFLKPDGFVSIVPAYLPNPLLLVQISGAAEIAGALGLQTPWPKLRRAAAIGLMLLFVSVFPANLYQAMHDIPINGKHISPVILWGRLFLQPILIWLVWWCTTPPKAER